MNDFMRKVRRVAPYTEFDWSEESSKRNLQVLQQRLRQSPGQQRGVSWRMVCVVAAVLVAVAATGIFVHWYRPASSPLPSPLPSADAVSETSMPLQLSDGSQAIPLDPETRMVVEAVSERLVNITLGTGAARFNVTPDTERRFEVDAGMIKVIVLGTSFTVVRKSMGVSVTVHRGVVRAEWSGGSREIRPAEGRVVFGQHGGTVGPVERSRYTGTAAPTLPDRGNGDDDNDGNEKQSGATRQRSLNRTGGHPHPVHRPANVDAPPTLQAAMGAADAERLKGNCQGAVDYLQNALLRFPNAPGAATAWFTLGRVLLEECHRPREAANAFYQTRQKQPDGVLAEDALAREVEAWHQARDHHRARMLALKYMKLYPDGVRKRSVRRFGSIE